MLAIIYFSIIVCLKAFILLVAVKIIIFSIKASKSLQAINAGEGVEKREPSYTVGGNANYDSRYGEQYGDSLKNWK